MTAGLERLRGGLIVSVQAAAGSAIGGTRTIVALARCAEANGAVAVRIEGLERIRAVSAAVGVPVVGLVKRAVPGYAPYITPTVAEAEAVAAAGAAIVAFDATARPRPDGAQVGALVAAIRAAGALAMADCARAADAEAATHAGAELCGSTLCGYTEETRGTTLPALDLVAALRRIARFAVAEGGIATPEDAARAFAAGADAICVGTAITNVDVLVGRFVAATPRAGESLT